MIPSSITALGGAHIDRRGRIEGATNPAASNPGHWFEEAGGGSFNTARNLARLGHDVEMISMRGGDSAGMTVEEAAEAAGVRYSPFTFLDRATPSYTAILEADGNLLIALADMALYNLFVPRRLQINTLRARIEDSQVLLCDTNLPAETLKALAEKAENEAKPLAAIAISPAKVIRLKEVLAKLAFLFMNEAEARAISGKSPNKAEDWPEIMQNLGLSGGVITRGASPAIGWHNGTIATLAPPHIETIGDVTGAGDSFAAGFLHAFLQNLPLGEMMRYGTAAAKVTVTSPLAVSEDMHRDTLQSTLALVPEAQILA